MPHAFAVGTDQPMRLPQIAAPEWTRYNVAMAEWMKELQLMVGAEFRSRPAVATLATVGVDGSPRGRTVIVRHIDAASGEIWATTDGRSEKARELAANSRAELVFWASHERMQFRVRGEVECVTAGPVREQLWNDLSNASRAMFDWPPPGTPYGQGGNFPTAISPGSPPRDCFVALLLRPSEVEALELNEIPHRRRRWSAANAWRPELVNP